MKIRKTDYGTIILHWVLVGGISVTVFTGLRMATEGPDHLWLNMFDSFLPRANVWVPHIWASVILVAVSVAYPVYSSKSGLSRRVQIDKSRLRALVGKRQAPRLGAIGAVMTWSFFLSMIASFEEDILSIFASDQPDTRSHLFLRSIAAFGFG